MENVGNYKLIINVEHINYNTLVNEVFAISGIIISRRVKEISEREKRINDFN